ncbi:hypothetical protein [Acanthamoeba castellanii mamavirus]|nr:hypothetical protein [Acanthamoeba castellanii mamavirus]
MVELYKDVEVENDYDHIKTKGIYDFNLEFKFEPNPVVDDKYVYKFDGDLSERYENNKLTEKLHEYFTNNSPKNLKLDGVIKLTLINNDGVNVDRRGVRDIDWKLHFWPEYVIYNEKNITFHDLIIACHKIKSHKFDRWYEMYRAKFDEFYVLKNSNGKKVNKEITAIVLFDHGS